MIELFQGVKPCSSCKNYKRKNNKGVCTSKSKQISVTCHIENKEQKNDNRFRVSANLSTCKKWGGASERCAHDAATTGTDAYKKNKFNGKASALIESKIKEAIKNSKREKRG